MMIERTARRNLLKNVVMRIVMKVREDKKRPKLGDVLAIYRTKKYEPGAKELFQEKFIKLYGNDAEESDEVKDEKYSNLTETMTRVK